MYISPVSYVSVRRKEYSSVLVTAERKEIISVNRHTYQKHFCSRILHL